VINGRPAAGCFVHSFPPPSAEYGETHQRHTLPGAVTTSTSPPDIAPSTGSRDGPLLPVTFDEEGPRSRVPGRGLGTEAVRAAFNLGYPVWPRTSASNQKRKQQLFSGITLVGVV